MATSYGLSYPGRGMKKFYNKRVPNIANDVLTKLRAGKNQIKVGLCIAYIYLELRRDGTVGKPVTLAEIQTVVSLDTTGNASRRWLCGIFLLEFSPTLQRAH